MKIVFFAFVLSASSLSANVHDEEPEANQCRAYGNVSVLNLEKVQFDIASTEFTDSVSHPKYSKRPPILAQGFHENWSRLPQYVRTGFWMLAGAAALGSGRYVKEDSLVENVFIVPILEEFLFRGLIQTGVKSVLYWSMGEREENEDLTSLAVLTSSGTFAASHANIGALTHFLWLGRGAGYLYDETGTFLFQLRFICFTIL